jgi:PAS domain S-box-containing protein
VNGQPAERVDAQALHQLFDGSALALLATDEDLLVRYCNPAAAVLLGIADGEALGEPVSRLIPTRGGALLGRLSQRAVREGYCSDFEFRFEDEGDVRFLAAAIWPISDEGLRRGAVLCFRDVTGRILLHEAVGQRRKMNALAKMAGSMAHHFNNLLGSLVTRVDFCRNSGDMLRLKRSLDSMARPLQRATELLDGLLAFAEADFRDEDLADLTETVITFLDEMAPALQERAIELQLSLPTLPVIEVPRRRLTTVLRHVVDNALEAMKPGGRLGVEIEPGNDDVTLRISDTGCGLSREQLEQVFEPFYSTKTRETASGPEPHAGLGLSVALGIVRGLGGEMSIASKAGECTVVEIQIPRHAGTSPGAAPPQMKSHSDLRSLDELAENNDAPVE